MNNSGVRGDLVPAADGSVTYGQMFALQPFGNSVIVMDLTGAQLKRLLEQQFRDSNTAEQPNMLMPSAGFGFAYDVRRPAGERIVSRCGFNGRPDRSRPHATACRPTASSPAAATISAVFTEGTNALDAGLDLDALEAYLKTSAECPTGGRVKSLHRPRPDA